MVTLLAIVLAIVWALGGAGRAGAQTPAGPEVVEVKVVGSSTLVARVTVRSPKPVAGNLRCTCSQVSTRVDLPTGGEKSVWLPFGAVDPYFSGQVVWDIPGAKDPEAQVAVTRSGSTYTAALAVLPSALGSRAAPSSVSTRGRAILDVIELTPDDIEQRAWVLEGFAALATTSKELGSLSQDGRTAVLGWVERGGELLVDDNDPVPGISEQPTDDRNAFVGLGIVRRTANAIRTGQWETAMLPPTRPTVLNSVPTRRSISLKSAVRLAPAGALLAGLLVYALGVGPLAYMLGRRRNRPMLMWVAVPLTAAVTTAGVLGIGLALRQTAQDQYVLFRLHGRIADRATVARAVVEGSSANRLRVPTGWTAAGEDVKVEVGTVSTASVDLAPGGLTEVRFNGDAAPTPAPFTVQYDANGTLTVTSTAASTLTNMFVIAQGFGQLGRTDLPDLAPGASNSVVVPVTPTYTGSSLDGERESLAAMAQDAGIFGHNVVVVIAEISPRPAAGVPASLTKNAKALREFAAVAAIPSGPRVTRSGDVNTTANLMRVDIPISTDTVALVNTSFDDVIWVNGTEVAATDGPVPAGAIQNGAIVLRSQTAGVVESTGTEFVQ